MMRVRFILCFFVLLTGVRFLSAQQRITLQQAIDEARQYNPDLQAKRLTIGLAEADQKRFGSFFLSNPELEFESVSDKRFANQGEGGEAISLSQEVEIAGQQFLRRSIMGSRVDRTDAEIKAFENDLIAEVKHVFYQAATMQEKVSIGRSIVDLNKQLAEIAERRYRAGDISELDYNLILVERDRSIAEQFALESQLTSVGTAFNRLLGRPVSQMIEAFIDTSILVREFSTDQLTSLAFEQRQDWKALQFEQSASSKSVTLSWLNVIPNPKVSLSLSRQTSIFENDGIVGDPAITGRINYLKDTDRLLMFRLGLSIPIVFPFLYGQKQADIQQAQVENNIISANVNSKRLAINAEVFTALNRFEKSREAMKLFQDVLPRLDVNINLLTKGYQGGQLSLSTLLVEKDRIFRTKFSYLETLLEYNQAKAELERAVGGKLP